MTTPPNIWTAPAMGGDVTRLPCCIPFCRRTTEAKNGLREWVAKTQRFYPVSVLLTVTNIGGRHARVTRAGCTRKDRYQASETRRLCRGLESPRIGPISHPGHRIWDKLKNQAMEGAMY